MESSLEQLARQTIIDRCSHGIIVTCIGLRSLLPPAILYELCDEVEHSDWESFLLYDHQISRTSLFNPRTERQAFLLGCSYWAQHDALKNPRTINEKRLVVFFENRRSEERQKSVKLAWIHRMRFGACRCKCEDRSCPRRCMPFRRANIAQVEDLLNSFGNPTAVETAPALSSID